MMDTIVIFGATGSVGVYTALFLKKKGYNIIAVGQRKSDNGFFAEYDIPYYSVNIANKNDFNILPVSGVDQVYILQVQCLQECRDTILISM